MGFWESKLGQPCVRQIPYLPIQNNILALNAVFLEHDMFTGSHMQVHLEMILFGGYTWQCSTQKYWECNQDSGAKC